MWQQEPPIWHWVLDVALMGVVHGIRSFVPLLVVQNSGHVLNTGPVGGLTGPYAEVTGTLSPGQVRPETERAN